MLRTPTGCLSGNSPPASRHNLRGNNRAVTPDAKTIWLFRESLVRAGAIDNLFARFDKHLFNVGEYVTVTEHDGVARPFRVVSVAPAIQRG